jgi:signal transduction histidine kinase
LSHPCIARSLRCPRWFAGAIFGGSGFRRRQTSQSEAGRSQCHSALIKTHPTVQGRQHRIVACADIVRSTLVLSPSSRNSMCRAWKRLFPVKGTTAALDFGDRRAAQEYVDAMRANPRISAAALYDVAGKLFVSYAQMGTTSLPATLTPPAPARTSGGLLDVTAPIRQDGESLGLVLLQTPADPLIVRLQRDGPIALLLAMAALLVALQSAAQLALRRVNASLTRHAEELAAANQSLQEQIAQREEVEAALRQAQKMEAIGQLTGGVAHDFNNLLQVVLGSLERLRVRASRGGGRLDSDLDRLVEAAMQGGHRAATLTRRLLAFSRQQPLEPKQINVNKLVTGMSDMLSRTLGEAVKIEVILAGGLWRVMADENQLENALLNLAVNARDAMPGGGKLTIETANAHLDEAYARMETDVTAGQYVLLAVTDSGTGMPPEVLTKVFEPFFTTKGIGEGTGLGLSQVYGFIKQSGGHVKIYSEVGQGTTIKIYLPRLLLAAEESSMTEPARSAPAGHAQECILVVEDEPGVRGLSVGILSDLGYTVLEASDGPSALAMLKREPSISLLFTDVGLPNGMTGRQLADTARQIRPDVKVLFTTGYARNAIVHDGRVDPGVELIGKPFSAIDLAFKIRAMLNR